MWGGWVEFSVLLFSGFFFEIFQIVNFFLVYLFVCFCALH